MWCLEPERRTGSADELPARLKAIFGIFRERPLHQPLELRWDDRLLLEVCEGDGELRGTPEGRLAGQALVQEAAQRVEIGPAVDLFAADLLGRDVVDRAEGAS